MLPLFLQCRRYAAHFAEIGVCAAIHTAARVDAVPFSAVGVSVMLPICASVGVGAALRTAARVDVAPSSAVGVGVMMPFFPLFVLPLTLRLG